MVRYFLSSVLYVSFFTWKCYCQTSTNWGDSAGGIQIYIGVTNKIVKPGEEMMVFCMATNIGPKVVMFTGDPNSDMQVHLNGINIDTNYDVSRFPPGSFHPGGQGYGLRPGDTQQYVEPVLLPRDASPGTYELKAQLQIRLEQWQSITNRSEAFQFTNVCSNPYKIQITR